jgi:uncharacterized protein (TIGR00251 family)
MSTELSSHDIISLLDHDGELRLRVVPAAKVEKLAIENGSVKIWIRAAPEDGKANRAVAALLSKHLDLPKNAITIISGHKSRDKRVRITIP